MHKVNGEKSEKTSFRLTRIYKFVNFKIIINNKPPTSTHFFSKNIVNYPDMIFKFIKKKS
jgi:hypothetical protein